MNKKFTLSQGVIFIIIFIIIVPFIAKLIISPEEQEMSSTVEPVLVKDKEVTIDKNLSIIDQFLKYERSENIEYLKQFDIQLKITKSLDGEILEDDYKIPLFSSVEANPLNLVRYFKPGYEINILDYKYEESISGMESFSRCKVKKVGDSDDKSGWLNCGWIDVSLTRKISSTQKNNLWQLCKNQLICSSYGKSNFYNDLHLGLKKEDIDSVKNAKYDIYKSPKMKEVIC